MYKYFKIIILVHNTRFYYYNTPLWTFFCRLPHGYTVERKSQKHEQHETRENKGYDLQFREIPDPASTAEQMKFK